MQPDDASEEVLDAIESLLSFQQCAPKRRRCDLMSLLRLDTNVSRGIDSKIRSILKTDCDPQIPPQLKQASYFDGYDHHISYSCLDDMHARVSPEL